MMKRERERSIRKTERKYQGTHSVMTRWKLEPLKWRGLPILPTPFSPVCEL